MWILVKGESVIATSFSSAMKVFTHTHTRGNKEAIFYLEIGNFLSLNRLGWDYGAKKFLFFSVASNLTPCPRNPT